MSASLVGSEMCIRDRQTSVTAKAARAAAAVAARRTQWTSHAPPVSTKHCSAVSSRSAATRARPTGSSEATGRNATGRYRSATEASLPTTDSMAARGTESTW
eukprot:8304455-Alexandrium_andersonii.AAC.1